MVVRVVDSSINAAEVLELLSDVGVVDVYLPSVVKHNRRVLTKACIVSFAGVCCPSEQKVWSPIFRVYQFYPEPQQCRTSPRYGHEQRTCKSAPRCKICSGFHFDRDCSASESLCVLCENEHPADSQSSSVRLHELDIIRIIYSTRPSPCDAQEILKRKSSSFTNAAESTSSSDSSFPQRLDDAIQKFIARAMDGMIDALIPALIEVFTETLTVALASLTVTLATDLSPPRNHSLSSLSASDKLPLSTGQGSVIEQDKIDLTPAPLKRRGKNTQ